MGVKILCKEQSAQGLAVTLHLTVVLWIKRNSNKVRSTLYIHMYHIYKHFGKQIYECYTGKIELL